jgi:hypothetical protein
VDDDEIQLIMQQCALNISPSAIQSLHKGRNNQHVSTDQIRRLKRQWCMANLVLNGNKASAAERLLVQLEENPSIKYVILSADKDLKGLITIRNMRKSSTSTQSVLNDRNEVTQVAGDILDRLSIAAGTKLLLCALWVTEKGLKYFSKFPSVLGLDTTQGTNSEKRPLARGTAKNMLRNNIPFLNCFLPSECQWVWHWLFQEGLPQLITQPVLHSIRIVLTDGDDNIYNQVDVAIRSGIIPNAVHRLCSWHKVNRNYVMSAKKLVRPDNTLDRNFIDHVARWLYFLQTQWRLFPSSTRPNRSFCSGLTWKWAEAS